MKRSDKKERLGTTYEGTLVIAGGTMLLLWFSSFRSNPFLFDDNYTQWSSVIDYAFSELFSGRFPYWNPYQWAGFRINEVGYYSLYNPMMVISYIAYKAGLSDTISNYVFVTYNTGNLVFYLLCRFHGLGKVTRIFLPLLYGCSFGYLAQGCWYYVFTLYGCAPVALFLVFLTHGQSASTSSFYFAVVTGFFWPGFFIWVTPNMPATSLASSFLFQLATH